ncbi:SRPBCC domain-containing protein [Nocardioides nanhaiensis]|uniref:SRPBCC domain-containing protein n=1 Tax=Nocardioides nanhaiensis TaxID=1476871 RepID=A0ABP8W8A8_9ACTN
MPSARPSASVTIAAPIERVWQVMTETDRYGEWNPFVVEARTAHPPRVDEPILLTVRWRSGRTTRSPERISAVETPAAGPTGEQRALLSYTYEGWPARLGLVRGVRHQRLTQEPGGPTTYETVEEFSGPLVRLAGPARVADGFARHAQALRTRCETDEQQPWRKEPAPR